MQAHYPELIMRLTQLVHDRIRESLRPGDLAIDATVGNGHDTRLLAELVGATGHVHGFDIQHEALLHTRQHLDQDLPGANVELHLAGHEAMARHLPGAMIGATAAIVFNLGYLPGGDKSVTTQAETTLAALKLAWETYLRPGGLLCILCYPGHPGGEEEARQVADWLDTLDTEVIQHASPGPVLHLANK